MSTPTNPLSLYLEKLLARAPMSSAASEAFLATRYKVESFDTYRDIVREGERTENCALVIEGLVSRYKTLRNGGRQIVSFHIRRDMVDLPSCLIKVADHTIRTHMPTTIAKVASLDMLKLAEDFPELGRAFWFDSLVDAAIFGEWTLNVGRRGARERVAHLLLEFAYRLQSVGLSDGTSFTLPVTQADLADATGLSPVHVNRSLKVLRIEGLIRMVGKSITIDDAEALARVADFTPLYLHPEGPRILEPTD
jgi:CRP-like cAMP-binding protein